MSRAHRSLWLLIAVTVLAAGLLAQALAAPAGIAADTLLTASILLLAASATLLVRGLRHLTGRGIAGADNGPGEHATTGAPGRPRSRRSTPPSSPGSGTSSTKNR